MTSNSFSLRVSPLILCSLAILGTLNTNLILFSLAIVVSCFIFSEILKTSLAESSVKILLTASIFSLFVTIFFPQSDLSLHYSLCICCGFTFLNHRKTNLTLLSHIIQCFSLYFLHFQNLSYLHLLILTLSSPLLLQLTTIIFIHLNTKLALSWFFKLGSIASLFTILFYLFIPRLSDEEEEFYYNQEATESKQSTHSLLSNQEDDHISLKGIEKLKLMQEPVFNFSYKFHDEANKLGPYLYFKKQSYELYEDGEWKTNITAPTLLQDAEDGAKDQWVTLQPSLTEETKPSIEVEVKPIIPVSSYFGIGHVLAFQTDQLFLRAKDNYSQLDQNQLLPYAFKSDFKLPFGNFRPVSGQVLPNENCYQIPEHLKPVLKQMLPKDSDLHSLVLLSRIESQLKKMYRYSLTSKGDGREPLYDLILGKQGWCVHFATAMTLLARSQGYPARVASGLCVLTPPEYPAETTARLSHSHTWCEVYIEPLGWTLWDATPEAGINQQNTVQMADVELDEHPFLAFWGQFTGQINTHQPTSQFNLIFLVLLSFFITTYLLVTMLKGRSKDKLTQANSAPSKLFQEKDLDGIWNELNHILLPSQQLKSKESIQSHIGRLAKFYPEIDFYKLSRLHNSVIWGHNNLSEEELNWVRSELDKLQTIQQTSFGSP